MPNCRVGVHDAVRHSLETRLSRQTFFLQPAKALLVRPGVETASLMHASRRAAIAKRAYVVVRDTVRDYETLEKRLAEAERRLLDARAHVRRQKELIEFTRERWLKRSCGVHHAATLANACALATGG